MEGEFSEVRQESFKKCPIGGLFGSSQCCCIESTAQMQSVRKGGVLGESDSPRQAANRSYALPKSMVEPVNLILSSSLTTVRTLKAQLKPIEKAIATELRATSPQTLQTIPGLGPVFAAGIVSEIGDVRRFEREESLAKFCGLTGGAISRGSSRERVGRSPRPATLTCATTWSRRPTR